MAKKSQRTVQCRWRFALTHRLLFHSLLNHLVIVFLLLRYQIRPLSPTCFIPTCDKRERSSGEQSRAFAPHFRHDPLNRMDRLQGRLSARRCRARPALFTIRSQLMSANAPWSRVTLPRPHPNGTKAKLLCGHK